MTAQFPGFGGGGGGNRISVDGDTGAGRQLGAGSKRGESERQGWALALRKASLDLLKI